MELSPISASLGAMGSLPRKLDELLATRHWALRGGVMDEVEQLTTHIHILHNFLVKLSNAHDPPMTARYWMKDVRELSYDMVDCADQFVHAHDRAKIRRATCRKIITQLKVNRFPERWKWRPWITNKVSEFRARAQEAIQRYRTYKLYGCASNPGYSRVGRELPTMSDPGDLVGIDGTMNELDRLLSNGGERLKVVSIVGAGGIGKTTLAQKLFAMLHGQFECRAFVRTSQKPDMRGILRNIFLQVRPHLPPDYGEVHHLIQDLRIYLQDKRYFIIIDDLWTISVWDVVSRAFPEGDCCSRIITTTEIMEVALACSGFSPEHIFKMESLSDDDSEKLLLQRILVSGNRSPQQFNDVLPQITKNCGGLPLAIIIVASILARQPEKLEQWGCLQNSYGSNFGANPTMEGFIGQILNISFNSLPRYLKTCLLHLSTYPEGCQFLKDDLVKQWVAEGFICANKEEDMEEVAESYFDELVSTGLIQVTDINYDSELLSYSVHHVILDFITYKSIEENFITVVDYSQTTTPHTDKVRRLSLNFGSAIYATTPASTRLSQVRSLFFSGLFNCMPLFMEFKLLRVIILHFWGDTGNMSLNLAGICELFRLRYLKVTSNVTTKLPDQIKAMKCLETLEISGGLCDVPPDIFRLSGLLHLRLRGGTNLPDGIGCMRSLRTLMYFELGNSSEDNIRGLGELTNLWHLHLTYSSSPSSEHLKRNLVALASALGKLCNLRSLTLAAGTADTVVLFDGLGVMSIPVSLERLELLPPICIFSRIPEWIGHLRKIRIMKVAVRELLINDIDILTGLPSLTVLSLRVQTVPEGRTIFRGGAFPVLKYFNFSCAVLCMSFMPGAMPNLRTLELRFNTHLGEKYSNMLAGSEYLINLQDITGHIGAATESYLRTAESAIKDAISKHPRCPRLNVQWVDPVEEEYFHSQKQHGKQEKGTSHEIIEKTNEMNEHANSGLSVLPDQPSTVTSPRLETGTRAGRSASALSKVCIQDGNVPLAALSKVVVAKKAVGDLGFLVPQHSLDQSENKSRRMHPANNDQSYSSKKALRTPQGFSHKRVISLLLRPRNWKPPADRTFFLDSYEVGELCFAAEQIFMQEPTVLQLKAPVKVFGNLHGQFGDLMRLFDEYGYPAMASDITYIDYLFLGDYVDRGQHSLETITLLLALKIEYPEHIYLIRGNHEAADINTLFGFRLECIERMGESDGIWAWTRFNQLFNYLPLAATIEKKIICMHGGIGRSIKRVEQIEKIERPITMDVGSIILMDLLWSDPTENDTVQGLRPNARGPGLVTFGPDQVTEFCKRNKLQLIIRSHECVMDGFEHFAHGQLITLFSATNYCGTAGNAGAILVVGRELVIVPKLIHPLPPPVNSPESSLERAMDATWMQELNIQRPPTPTRGRPHYAGDRNSLAYLAEPHPSS